MQNLRLIDPDQPDVSESHSTNRRSQAQRLVRQWHKLAADAGSLDSPRAKSLMADILRLCEPLVRQFFLQMLAEDSLSELDDLINITLSRVENKLITYDSSRSAFESWVKYQCVRPIFKQHLEEIGYRTIKLEPYIAVLQSRLAGTFPSPPTNLIGRLVQGLEDAQVRPELAKMRQMLNAGRKVILRRDPRLVPALSLNCPIRPGNGDEEYFDIAAAPQIRDMEEACRKALHESLSYLTAGERMVILGLFFANRSRKELAEEAGISSARVSQLLQQGYKRLREVLGPAFFRDCVPDA
ncbi:sigma-70 family RNA polymerase sigma factor [Gloeobacter kilaueensis]|uniref:RNA polymerase sigma factor SigF n=1 Tax=Gloeobacter kilaueensis (strain ATCC BAA-2537 / CCAP 1431/1 / ULC 316 / JS1) TaxID=1183438 RepID=U5QLK2_GLOK1|nr:sigma-70 family RNA polymerase sigma factor [Gloeobacter kilaueensis]AGY59773.1 RNA polymerase sigma factor SigF [Gloeobacter kilaueensis JS1]